MDLNEFYLRTNFNLDKNNGFFKEMINFLDKNGYQIDLSEVIKFNKYGFKKKLIFFNGEKTLKAYLLDKEIILHVSNESLNGLELVIYIKFDSMGITEIAAEYFSGNNHTRLIDMMQVDGNYVINGDAYKELEYFASDFASSNLLLCAVIKEITKQKDPVKPKTPKMPNEKSLS